MFVVDVVGNQQHRQLTYEKILQRLEKCQNVCWTRG